MLQLRIVLIPALLLPVWSAVADEPQPAPGADHPQATFYQPVERQIEGWTVELDPELLSEEHREAGERALQALANHLQRVTWIVPEEPLARLQQVRIRVDWSHPVLKSMQYHPSRQWLVNNGHDPQLARRVHIPQAADLLARKTWRKHPYVVLHELAHAYHDQFLDFDHAQIKATYDAAKAEGLYQEVLLFTGETVSHYGLTNHKEYFAEATEAWFGVNDFYPFVRAELQQYDPRMFELLQQIWGS